MTAKLPLSNLACNGDFELPWDVEFDFAIAQSLFTHLPFNFVRFCLARLAPKMPVGRRFYATYHAVPDDGDLMQQRVPSRRTGQPSCSRSLPLQVSRPGLCVHRTTLAGEPRARRAMAAPAPEDACFERCRVTT
ncbi:MAG: hypothetical protein WDN48_01545 [Pseudolabrys sp.]